MPDGTFTADIEPRFRDLDPEGHVNNAIYVTYLEQARAAFYDQVIGVPLPEAETAIVHMEIDYRRQIDLGDDVTVALSIPELGGSSIPMSYEITTNGRVAAVAETVQVTWDRDVGEAVPIPQQWRDNIEAALGG